MCVDVFYGVCVCILCCLLLSFSLMKTLVETMLFFSINTYPEA